MRRVSPVLLTLGLLALPAPAVAGTWTAPDAATRSGTSYLGGLDIGGGGRLALGFGRRLHGADRAELRTGTIRGGIRGASVLLDRDADHAVGAAVPHWASHQGALAVAWTFFRGRNHRLRAATLDPSGKLGQVVALTGPGESTYAPRFVPGTEGAGLMLEWGRRSINEASSWAGGSWTPARIVPGGGIGDLPALAETPDGGLVAVWAQGGDVFASTAPGGGAFGPARQIGGSSGYARDAALAVGADGAAVAVWLGNAGHGNAVYAAQRPRGGSFGDPVLLDGPEAGARNPHVVAAPNGAYAVTYVTTDTGRGWGTARGIARLRVLTSDGRPVGPRVRLSANGERTHDAALVSDGSSAVFTAWITSGPGRDELRARRIAPGPIVGKLRTVSRRDIDFGGAPQLAGGDGSAAVAWVANDRIYASRYR